jgi:lactoylglutathione lyase
MKLNHINLAVTDVAAAADFLEAHFGLTKGGGNAGMALLTDSSGLALTLMKSGKADGARYPPTFHVGFLLDSDAEVDAVYRRLTEAGLDVNAPERRHAYGFYVNAPGGFTIEVGA